MNITSFCDVDFFLYTLFPKEVLLLCVRIILTTCHLGDSRMWTIYMLVKVVN